MFISQVGPHFKVVYAFSRTLMFLSLRKAVQGQEVHRAAGGPHRLPNCLEVAAPLTLNPSRNNALAREPPAFPRPMTTRVSPHP